MNCPRIRGPRRVLLAAVLVLCALFPSACATAASQAIGVSGDHLVRAGHLFIVHGVQIVGIVAPDGALRGQYLIAHQHFGAAELKAARAWGANTIRFQLSEPGLDPRSSLYTAAYVTEIRSAVHMARQDGLAVILSLQDQPPSGEANPWPMPTAETSRAWSVLAPLFKNDRGVMYELFNEPALPPNPTDWRLWAQGGTVPPWRTHSTFQAVGAQSLIDQIRATGARNVIIVDGLRWAESLLGQPPLHDPAHELAYAVHPYFGSWMKPNAVTAWNRNFGFMAAREPVIATEWSEHSSSKGCNARYPVLAKKLINYLKSHDIGVVGFAFDLPGTIVTGWSYTPTTYDNFNCAVPGDGPGALIHAWFTSH
ncbi:MAG: glycoside hydrolase family 5 protein [Chloroflexi bacterium]|nr:glycoside hydrolase family 5 protein [Chloroflexota bacterium]